MNSFILDFIATDFFVEFSLCFLEQVWLLIFVWVLCCLQSVLVLGSVLAATLNIDSSLPTTTRSTFFLHVFFLWLLLLLLLALFASSPVPAASASAKVEVNFAVN